MTRQQARAAVNALDTLARSLDQGTAAIINWGGPITLTPQPDGSMQITYEPTNETGG